MGLLIALVLAVAVPVAASAAPAPGLSFVQATVVAPDASARTLTFVDASGRSRSHPVTGAAAARVGRLRPGDEVIVVLAGAEGVVQDVKVSHASLSVPAAEVVAPAADPEAQWTVVPSHEMRPTWPNPYSRFYRGPRPAPPPRQQR
jgi:hypothetical protein